MTRDQIKYAERILQAIKELEDLRGELRNNYLSIGKNSTSEEIFEVFQMIVKHDKVGLFIDAIKNINAEINKQIDELEEELKAL